MSKTKVSKVKKVTKKCPTCNGSGKRNGKPCWGCNGRKTITTWVRS